MSIDAFEELLDNPWTLTKKVLPQHTDHAGVMWHGSYISWLEEVRVMALSKVGFSYKDLSQKGFEMPVVSLEINYHQSLKHGDDVLVQSRSLPRVGPRWPWISSFLVNGDLLAAKARIDLVLVRKVDEKYHLLRQVPDFLEEYFLKLQSGP